MLDVALTTATCRDRLLQLLNLLEAADGVTQEALMDAVEATKCSQEHDLHYATLMSGLISQDGDGYFRLSRAGDDFLLDNGAPSPAWARKRRPDIPALRAWQVEALRSWCDHGRHGVVEAVTGTGKSRVGIEAAAEALDADFSVVVAVPTRDLVDQWVRAFRRGGINDVGALADGARASFLTHSVIVGTIHSLYADPPVREDGKVLLVADECHRYGAEQWRRGLHPSYRRRLGLTATFERNDEGINELISYFGGGPVYRIGFDRAIAEDVVAHYDVKLHGVDLGRSERANYDDADRLVRDCRTQLLAAGFPAEPFGAFLHEVQQAAADETGSEDPTIVDVARRYLKGFSERIDVLANATAKFDAARLLAPRVRSSRGALLFTRRVSAAEQVAEILQEAGVSASAIHSKLTPVERRDRLAGLKSGRYQAIVAPTVLDEGIDVPDIDLAVVLGGSKSRRQMIQRMGRVLRLKPDGRKATFIVVYAKDTVEDLTQEDGSEGCLDLIVASADSVAPLDFDLDVPSRPLEPAPPADSANGASEGVDSSPDIVLPAVDSLTVRISRKARERYGAALGMYGSSKVDLDRAAREALARDVELGCTVRCENERIAVRGEKGTWYLSADLGAILRFRPDNGVDDRPVVIDERASNRADKQDKSEPPGPAADLVGQLERLAALRERELLTYEEFALAKARLLS